MVEITAQETGRKLLFVIYHIVQVLLVLWGLCISVCTLMEVSLQLMLRF